MNTKNEAFLKVERQNRIRRMVEQSGRMTVGALSEYFRVSEATIRRDLEELEVQGWVQRTHGGALRLERATREPPILQRFHENQSEKQRIARAAVELIHPDETIFLGSGSTVLQVARNLPEAIPLTIITNSLPVVNELASRPKIDLIVIGGMLRSSELSMVGHTAEHGVQEFRADRVFMGIRAIDVHHGFTNDYLPETSTDRAILKIAPQVIVVADHHKFGRISTVLVGPVTVAQIIITGREAPQETVTELNELGIEVIQV